jgi:hypothetical protein
VANDNSFCGKESIVSVVQVALSLKYQNRRRSYERREYMSSSISKVPLAETVPKRGCWQ